MKERWKPLIPIPKNSIIIIGRNLKAPTERPFNVGGLTITFKIVWKTWLPTWI